MRKPKPEPETRASLTVRIPPDLRKWLGHRAVDRLCTVNDLILEALEQYQSRAEKGGRS